MSEAPAAADVKPTAEPGAADVKPTAASPTLDMHDALMKNKTGIVVENTENKWTNWLTLENAINKC